MQWLKLEAITKRYWLGLGHALRGCGAAFLDGWRRQRKSLSSSTATTLNSTARMKEPSKGSMTSIGRAAKGRLYPSMNIVLLVGIGILTDRAFLQPKEPDYPVVEFSRDGSDPVWIAGHPKKGRYHLWQASRGYFFKDICPIHGELNGEPDWAIGATLSTLVLQDRGQCSNAMPPYAGYTRETYTDGTPILRTHAETSAGPTFAAAAQTRAGR